MNTTIETLKNASNILLKAVPTEASRTAINEANRKGLFQLFDTYFADSESALKEHILDNLKLCNVTIAKFDSHIGTNAQGHKIFVPCITIGDMRLHFQFSLVFDNGWEVHMEGRDIFAEGYTDDEIEELGMMTECNLQELLHAHHIDCQTFLINNNELKIPKSIAEAIHSQTKDIDRLIDAITPPTDDEELQERLIEALKQATEIDVNGSGYFYRVNGCHEDQMFLPTGNEESEDFKEPEYNCLDVLTQKGNEMSFSFEELLAAANHNKLDIRKLVRVEI
ncbi:hypothetical protein [Vibrio barjaei]|uniref:hypothetical protein n=1 Tax=Vibrio barjaei TaxID=1676683 RepID=UPI002284BFD0|nr:hypothetical protein [Vibrio barjaei]MCY9874782.1 hypothetical protein [Vibrio barjaei]